MSSAVTHSTDVQSIDILTALGYKAAKIPDVWKQHFQRNPCGSCLNCGRTIIVNRLISSLAFIPTPWDTIRGLAAEYPDVNFIVHFKPNYPIDITNPEDIARCQQWLSQMTHKARNSTLIPVCQTCWLS